MVPNDPLEAYESGGYPDLTEYFNPTGLFKKVFCVSPWEEKIHEKYGMQIIPVSDTVDFANYALEISPQCIHAYDIRAGAFVQAVREQSHHLKSYINKIPFIVSIHDTNPDRIPKDFPKPYPHAYISISHATEEFIERHLEQPEVTVFGLPNSVDTDVFKPAPCAKDLMRYHPFKKTILFVGRITQQKNQHTLARAMEILEPDGYGYIVIPYSTRSKVALAQEKSNIQTRPSDVFNMFKILTDSVPCRLDTILFLPATG